MDEVDATGLAAHLRATVAAERIEGAAGLVIDLDSGPWHLTALEVDALTAYPGVVVGATSESPTTAPPTVVDVALTSAADPPRGWVSVPDLRAGTVVLAEAVGANPQASRILVQLLRQTPAIDASWALLRESTAYSTLLGGPEFAAWLADRGELAHRGAGRAPVRVERRDGHVEVILDRPEVHNAFDAGMREMLTDVLVGLALDASAVTIGLSGEGPSFCAGGDLSEFGTTADPATAHLVRTDRAPARWLARLGDRIEARVHGACVGAGVELAAFAGRVVAAPDATFRLPEVAMGLIPGAGGTVSIPRRIGRHLAAWLALTGEDVDAPTALAWGLVDRIA